MTALTVIRNFRACIKASGIIPSDIPHISKINWTCKDHEGDHRERERILKQYAWSTKECWSQAWCGTDLHTINKKEIQISTFDIVQ